MNSGSRLSEGLERLGIVAGPACLEQFGRYQREIALWNPRLRLVADPPDQLVVRHLLDCAAAVPLLDARLGSSAPRLADLGSGAGLPGIPVAILMPRARVFLVERSARRAAFLRNAVAVVGLRNVTVREIDAARFEEAAIDAFLQRAFLPLARQPLAREAALLAPGGFICAYKGRRSGVEAELDALRRAGAPLDAEVVPLGVPFLAAERHLVLLRPRGEPGHDDAPAGR